MAPVILNRTPLASIVFKDGNGTHIRVYYQDEDGNIRETFYDDGNGWALREGDIVGVGRLNTGIAATVWNNGTQVPSAVPVTIETGYSHCTSDSRLLLQQERPTC